MTYQELLITGKSRIPAGKYKFETPKLLLEHTSLAEKCHFLLGVDSLEGLFDKEREFYRSTGRSLPFDMSALVAGRCATSIDVGKAEDILNSHLAYHYEE